MKRFFVVAIAGCALCAGDALALPFNKDMYDVQIKAGQSMRPRPEGAISKGSLSGQFPLRVEKKEDVVNFQNPKKGDAVSTAHGKRLFEVNCSPCHGNIEKSPYEPGVAGRMMGAPDLRNAMYREKIDGKAGDGRTDGSIYQTIHFGNVIMPGYGWKFSPDEHWDIINYVRDVQLRAQQSESASAKK